MKQRKMIEGSELLQKDGNKKIINYLEKDQG